MRFAIEDTFIPFKMTSSSMLYYFVWFLATFTNMCLNAGLVLFVLGCANDRPHIGPSRRCLFSDSHTNLYDSANCSRARLEILVSKQ